MNETKPVPIWASETHSTDKYSHIKLTDHGSLIFYRPSLKGMNTNPTVIKTGGYKDVTYKLVVQDDCNVVLYESS